MFTNSDVPSGEGDGSTEMQRVLSVSTYISDEMEDGDEQRETLKEDNTEHDKDGMEDMDDIEAMYDVLDNDAITPKDNIKNELIIDEGDNELEDMYDQKRGTVVSTGEVMVVKESKDSTKLGLDQVQGQVIDTKGELPNSETPVI